MLLITCSINTPSLQHRVPLSCWGIFKSSFEFSGIYWQFNISQTMHVSCCRTQHSAHIWVVYTFCLSSEILRVSSSTALTSCVSYQSHHFQWVVFHYLCISAAPPAPGRQKLLLTWNIKFWHEALAVNMKQ